MQKLTQTGKT